MVISFWRGWCGCMLFVVLSFVGLHANDLFLLDLCRCCIKGSHLEVNDRLIKQPDLLNSSMSIIYLFYDITFTFLFSLLASGWFTINTE